MIYVAFIIVALVVLALTPWGKILLLSFKDWLFAEATPAEEELDRLEKEAEEAENKAMNELYGFVDKNKK
jgi:hypothetical protein